MQPRPTCAVGAICPAMRQTWRDGPYIRLQCDECGRTCSAPVVPQRGTAIVMPAALLLRRRDERAGVAA